MAERCRWQFLTVAAIAVIMATFLGCSEPELDLADEPVEQLPLNDEAASDEFGEESSSLLERVSLAELESLEIEPSWSVEFASSFSFSPYNNDDGVAVVAEPWPSSQRRTVFLMDSSGDELWSSRFPGTGYVSAEVKTFSSQSLIGAAAYTPDGHGTFRMLDEQANEIQQKQLEGVSSFSVSPDGESFFLLNRYTGDMTIYSCATGEERGSSSVGSEAVVDFIGETGLLLVQSEDHIMILNEQGTEMWQQIVEFRLRGGVAVTDDAQKIALTTRHEDSSLYLFDRSGTLLWKYLLPLGGRNDLHMSDDNSRLLVYNIGKEAGVFLMDLTEKEPSWRYSFIAEAEREEEADDENEDRRPQVRIRDVAFAPGGEVAVHAVVSHISSEVTETHKILFVDENGELQGKVALGDNIKTELSQDGLVAAVAEGEPDEHTGNRVLNELYYYDFTSLLSSEVFEGR